jgi:7-carboxy-7-deazaguanine synthase
LLSAHDELKFVLKDRTDYDWARQVIAERHLAERCPILFSPVAGELPAATLADWILADRLHVRLQVQLHKLLWGNMRGR